MKNVPLDSIIIPPDRLRKVFEPTALNDLAEDIFKIGLLHPLVLDNDGITLRAGERRYRALTLLTEKGLAIKCDGQDVPVGYAPTLQVHELNPIQLLELELHENTHRQNLTWVEEVEGRSRLIQLRRALDPTTTILSVAKELFGPQVGGSAQAALRDAEILAPFITDPEVRKAKNIKEGMSIVRQKYMETLNKALSARIDTFASPHQLFHGPAQKELYHLADGSVDCILTDPPYGIGADTMGPQSSSNAHTIHQYDDSPESFYRLIRGTMPHVNRVAAADAFLYLFCDIKHFEWLQHDLTHDFGWRVWPRPIVWNKNGIGNIAGDCNGPRYTYELILFATRGEAKVLSVEPDVISITPPQDRKHPAEKPVELYTNLLKRVCHPSSTILDFCCGSGTIFPAAHQLRMFGIGIEQDANYHAIAKQRMALL